MTADRGFACRLCGSTNTHLVHSFGDMALANALLDSPAPLPDEPRYPLEVVFCAECSLVQLGLVIPPAELFTNYPYFSSVSDALLEHARALAVRICRERQLSDKSLVVEIASNDGYLLRNYREAGVQALGIEPAANIAPLAVANGVPTINEFFDLNLARRLAGEGVQADVIHAHNVLAHVADLRQFARGVQALLKPAGVAIVEVPYVVDLIERTEFDTIYHEHLYYFSVTALQRLVSENGLAIADVERVPIHGGSLRLFISHAQATAPAGNASAMLEQERAWGISDPGTYEQFLGRISEVQRQLSSLLESLAADGRRLAAYGAAAKGATLLGSIGAAARTLDYVVDRSRHKQGKYMPGVHLPVLPVETLMERMPDYVVLLSWNFASEILEQQQAYTERGGKFIVPIPEPVVVP